MRIVVLGGLGWFGRAAADALRRDGQRPLVASRRSGGDLLIDAEDSESLRSTLRPGDIVIDAAGPFQHRSTRLLETCMALGCDVIDLSDSLDYATGIRRVATQIKAAGIRVLTSCSSVSAVSASLVRLTGIDEPVRVSVFLAPATANTSTGATGRSLLTTLGRPIRVRRGGAFVRMHPFSEERRFIFPTPVGEVSGWLGESPDGLLLPFVWPSLRDVDFWIDTRRRSLNKLFAAAARRPSLLRAIELVQTAGRRVTKYFGVKSGGFAVEVEGTNGQRAAAGFVHASRSYVVAVAPAVLAARVIAGDRDYYECGALRPDRYVNPEELVAWLEREGITAFGISQR